MVVIDASILLLILEENVSASVHRARERVEYLIDTLSKTGETIIIPTPALSECLVHAGICRTRISQHHWQAVLFSYRQL